MGVCMMGMRNKLKGAVEIQRHTNSVSLRLDSSTAFILVGWWPSGGIENLVDRISNWGLRIIIENTIEPI